jgi:adenosyl cobinamide kinase/adenosyl cobinamide phosphate guanylyltransferase
MAARVAAHRARRPDAWATVEAGADLAEVVAGLAGTVLVDSLGTWVAGVPGLAPDVAALCDALRARDRAGAGDTIVVSEEVGLGVHPPTEVGRRFADALGTLNRAVAAVADRALLVVAGRALRLDPVDVVS